MVANDAASPGIEFQVEKADFQLHLNFAGTFTPLMTHIGLLYVPLLARMSEFGVTAQDLRSDAGDGSVGGFSVNFWVLGFGAVIRIRVDRAEIECPNIGNVDIERLDRALAALDEVLREAHPALSYTNHAITVRYHGLATGIPSRDYLARFVTYAPSGIGPVVGHGATFYFGEQSPRVISNLTLDLSAVLADRLFFRWYAVYDGSQVQISRLRRIVEDESVIALQSVGLAVRHD